MSETFRVVANGKACEFDETQDKSLLETLERNDLKPHFHCRDGFCGACHCTIVSGETEYTIDPLAFIRDGEILLCCAKPLTDIEVNFD